MKNQYFKIMNMYSFYTIFYEIYAISNVSNSFDDLWTSLSDQITFL